jgi:PIN domain nuclease of toxin-antitoxin system
MKLLLDTHTVLWLFENSPGLSERAKLEILNRENTKFVSVASAWEIAIKSGLNKLSFNGGIDRFYSLIAKFGYHILPIEREHLNRVTGLPLIHRDPFDRLLIAAALADDLCLITADENIHSYDVQWLW